MTTKEELTFQVFQILTEYDLETFGQQQYTCEKIAEFIMQRDETQCTEVNNAHESAQKYMTAWQAAEDYATLITEQAERVDELHAEIERQAAVLQQAREAIGAVEWEWDADGIDALCPWCMQWKSDGHAPDCPRQAALAALDAEVKA